MPSNIYKFIKGGGNVTLNNLKYALFLNNKILLEKINQIEGIEILDIKKQIEDPNDKIDGLTDTTLPDIVKSIQEIQKKLHEHPNIDVLNNLSDKDGTLMYNGKEITGGGGGGGGPVDISWHTNATIYSGTGVHGVRYYNARLEYNVGGKWYLIYDSNNPIPISGTPNNALVKYSDGYFVPKIPANNATTDDIDKAKDELEDIIKDQDQAFNERYDVIINKISQIVSNTTKSNIHEYLGNNSNMALVVDINTLYSLTQNVILNLEFMIKNSSEKEPLNIKILENNIETLNDTLVGTEVQRYKLPSITKIQIFTEGEYELFLYVSYI